MIVLNKEIETELLEGGISRKIIAKGDSLMMVEVYFKKGERGAVHSHRHEQISYIHKGSFEFELNGDKKN